MSLKRHSLNLALALASFLLCTLLLEVAFRIGAHLRNQGSFDGQRSQGVDLPREGPVRLGHIILPSSNDRIIYALKPGLDVTYRGGHMTTNARGLRGPERPLGENAEVFRILAVGDSVMFGQGVSDGETYLALAERPLNELPGGRPVEVVNMAVPGYNTVMEVETLREKGLPYRPDLVLIHLVGNDFDLPSFIRKKESLLSLEKSFFVSFIKLRLSRNSRLDMLHRMKDHDLMWAPNRPAEEIPPEFLKMTGWSGYEGALRQLATLADENGFAVVLISTTPDDEARIEKALKLAKELGFSVLDIGPVFQTYLAENGFQHFRGSPLAISEKDGHFSVLGHEFVAEVLVEHLVGEKLLPP